MPEGSDNVIPWDDAEAPDCTPWLIEYVRVRLAEHAPDIMAGPVKDALLYLIPLTLVGLTKAPNGGEFSTYITFEEEKETPPGEGAGASNP